MRERPRNALVTAAKALVVTSGLIKPIAPALANEWKTTLAVPEKQRVPSKELVPASLRMIPRYGTVDVDDISPAFRNFCVRMAEQCRPADKTAREMRREQKSSALAELISVNEQVNKEVLYKRDRYDEWDIPGITSTKGRGDCEDYALLKRKRLIEQGWEPHNVLIAVVNDGEGNGHAVLIARLADGDYILDNSFNEVLHWTAVVNEHQYELVMQQSFVDPEMWEWTNKIYAERAKARRVKK